MTRIGPHELDSVTCADALEWLRALPDGCADAVVTDPPYGTTACAWDTVVPFEPMWQQLRRIVKPRAAIVMTASQPFTSRLVMSNPSWFRCEWIWEKPAGTGYLNANRQPMKNHESVIVFAQGEHYYRPVRRDGSPYRATSGAVGGFVRDKTVGGYHTVSTGARYPLSVMRFNSEVGYHPTQKPVALFAYLIRTYTQPGALVIDPFCGSGTTGVAARSLGRHFLLNDITPEYVAIAQRRLAEPFTPPLFVDDALAPRHEQQAFDLTGDD